MEVIGVGKEIFATTFGDLRSHHLSCWVNHWFGRGKRRYALDISVFSGRHPKIIGDPDDTLYSSLMCQAVGVFQKIWRVIGPVDVENPGLFLLAAGKEMRRGW